MRRVLLLSLLQFILQAIIHCMETSVRNPTALYSQLLFNGVPISYKSGMYGTAQRKLDAPIWVVGWQIVAKLTESVQTNEGACK